MTARRIDTVPPIIDGFLDDEVWREAPRVTGFTQRDPEEGEPATEQTTVQIVYDHEAIYIGIACRDREPDKIVSRLVRRDQWVETDRVSVYLDPQHDHRTGYFFSVSPSGWTRDGVLYNDLGEDDTWDGVWEAKAAIHGEGWSAEYKIPYRALRFSRRAEYTWGINVLRWITRKQERDDWVLVRQGESGRVSRFGHLEGIENIDPPNRFEILPFVVGRSALQPETPAHPADKEWLASAGLDLRHGLTQDIAINATINPDFGQVETDPAVLNLSVFETFFEERRPFFVEGSTLFRVPESDVVGISGPSRLFYSRRIGSVSGRLPVPEGSQVIDRPKAATILGAAKLSGKRAARISFNVFDAVTADEYAITEVRYNDPITGAEHAERRKERIEPLTNFFGGRVQQDVWRGSTVGMTVTAVNSQDLASAYVASVDENLKWGQNAYSLYTRLTGSRTGSRDRRAGGYEGVVYFSKISSWFGGQVYLDARSPEFQVNDLGFVDRADLIRAGTHVYAQVQRPWILARRSGFNLNAWSHRNYAGLDLRRGFNFNVWNQLKNYWFLHLGLSRDLGTQDDLETRGGPVMARPARSWYWLDLGTDERKLLTIGFKVSGEELDGGAGYSRRLGLTAVLRPRPNLQFELGPAYQQQFNFAQWIANIDGDGAGKHYVFGELKNQTLDLTMRANIAFAADLTFQMYVQSFVTAGDFSRFKELAQPYSYEFSPFDHLAENPDFSRRSLRSNAVLRWAYRPGSTFFLVWSQVRNGVLDKAENPDFHPFEGVISSFDDKGENILLVRFNYWLGL